MRLTVAIGNAHAVVVDRFIAYDALTDAQKALVENYATLAAAESRYAG